jgi:hypothetical protein
MRVQNPDQYASTLLNIVLPNERYTPERIRSMYGRSEIDLKFPTPIPVNITYQTAFVDDDGSLQIRDDVYGRDAKLLSILKGSERKVADSAIDRPRGSSSAPVRMPPGTFGSSGGGGGFSFFSALFGASPEPPRPPRSTTASARRSTTR